MNKLWITTAEVAVEPGDMPSGDTLGFMRIAMWATTPEDLRQKLETYLAQYRWKLLSMERTTEVDPSEDYGEEANQVIEEARGGPDAIGLGTYYSYRPN